MKYQFKDIALSDAEKLWLVEIYNSEDFDIKKTKVKLWDRLPKGFDPDNIDSRLYRNGHLTLIGIYHIDPNNEIFENVPRIIMEIRKQITQSPGIETVKAVDIAKHVDLSERDTEIAIGYMSELGQFFTSASSRTNEFGYTSISFNSDNAYDAYLSFHNIEDLMEEFYSSHKPKRYEQSIEEHSAVPKYRNNTAFIIMPIDPGKPELEDVCNTIKEVCAKFGIEAKRADDIEHQESITNIVLRAIQDNEFLVADLSHERPNVYYEIGYAHALNKRPILYRKTGTKLHFDLSVHNVPEYRNITDLKEKLTKRFEYILGRKP
ncbi:MAG: hypothetical protein KZQ95_06500 [Candidatus Thiodiazotropha sp. (ex Epidulcina cf. delphinae)]|nr:hypothetical protein [Candidatus Thiodiazotropha sp. (ex Epidulcina cf. delphinae)]